MREAYRDRTLNRRAVSHPEGLALRIIGRFLRKQTGILPQAYSIRFSLRHNKNRVPISLEEAILDKIRLLPPEKQKALLEYADTLLANPHLRQPLQSPKGLWADLDISISEEDIAEIRREMWKDFPRDNF